MPTVYDLVPWATPIAAAGIVGWSIVWRRHEEHCRAQDDATAAEAERNRARILPLPAPRRTLPPPEYIDTVAYEKPRVRGELGR
jgi:hypothetical protein